VKLILLIGFMVMNGLANIHAQARQEAPGADLIVHNAKIFTGNPGQPAASALAVKNGRIYSVGTDAEMLGLKNANTRIIDSGGRRLIPGIIDAHTHVLNEGGYNYTLRWEACRRCAGPWRC
jgi:predicted amidohydrolase YtcJ